MRYLPALLLLGLGGCFAFDDGEQWASRDDIVEAAAACGVPDFVPTKAGDAWAAYVPASITDHELKEQCIYDHFEKLGLLVTR